MRVSHDADSARGAAPPRRGERLTPEGQAAIEILVATLGGAAVGVERQWSGHATGAHARFAGIRTFTLMGSLAGTAGWLSSLGDAVSAAVLLTGGVALVVAAYVAASRREVDGTTEVASLVVLVAGFVAGVGHLALASGIFAATSLILVEKSRLHAFVARLSDAEMRAAARFAVMAVVVLPLLPEGPYGPLGGIRPRELWALVLFFSALSFAAYVARRAAGAGRGDAVAGLLGGLISSTSVTLGFSRTSRARTADTPALALGVLAACTVMYLRVLLTTAVLNPGLAVVLAPALAAPFLAGALAVAIGGPSHRRSLRRPEPRSQPVAVHGRPADGRALPGGPVRGLRGAGRLGRPRAAAVGSGPWLDGHRRAHPVHGEERLGGRGARLRSARDRARHAVEHPAQARDRRHDRRPGIPAAGRARARGGHARDPRLARPASLAFAAELLGERAVTRGDGSADRLGQRLLHPEDPA